MFKLRIVVPLLLLILSAAIPSNSHFPSVRAIDLTVGDVITIGKDLQIGFDGVPMDSRCPEGVFCIWEGDAVATMWAEDPSSERVKVKLHTHHGWQWQFTYGNYRITLIGVAPYPKIDERIDPDDYIATIMVANVSTPVASISWGHIKTLYR